MKIKNVRLSWKVLNHDFNSDKIINYDIFWKDSPEEIAKRIKRDKITTLEEFKESMRRMWMHDFWSKTECEILVSGLFTKIEPTKIDIWAQIEMNFDRIIEYIIKEMQIDFKKEKLKK